MNREEHEMKMSEVLKPCPFCGKRAKMKQTKRMGYTIRCVGCPAEMSQRVLHESLDWLYGKMVEQWNERGRIDE